jgi:hypothetical protein
MFIKCTAASLATILSGSSPLPRRSSFPMCGMAYLLSPALQLKHFNDACLKGQKPKINLARIKLLICHLDLCNESSHVCGITMIPLSGLKCPGGAEKRMVKMACVRRLSRLSFQFDVPVGAKLAPQQTRVFALALRWVGAPSCWIMMSLLPSGHFSLIIAGTTSSTMNRHIFGYKCACWSIY